MKRLALLVLLVAYKDKAPAPKKPPPTLPPGVPSTSACKVDDDCMVTPVAPSSNPCCEYTVTALPITRAYMEFVDTWRKDHCTGEKCPDLALPGAQLADCGYEPKCIAEKCTNACN